MTELRRAFERASLASVVVVDDCFDGPQIELEDRGNILEVLREENLLEDFKKDVGNGAPLNDASDLTGTMLANAYSHEQLRVKYSVALELVEDQLTPERELESLLSLLDGCGVNVSRVGSMADVPTDAHLVFLDYFLNDGGDRAKAIAAELKARDGQPPIVIVMSSNPVGEAGADAVRQGSRFFGGLFHYIPKSDLTTEFSATVRLVRILDASDAAAVVHTVVASLESSRFVAAVKQACDRICELSIFDYGFLEGRTLRYDGEPLGEHLAWLFSSYILSSSFEETLSEMWGKLDGLSFDINGAGATLPHTLIFDMYRRAQAEKVGAISTHPRAEDETRTPYVSFGDVLIRKKGEGDQYAAIAAGCRLVAVISPACDLAYSPKTGRQFDSEMPVRLVPGVLRSLHPVSTLPKGEDVVLVVDGEYSLVEWRNSYAFSVPYGQFSTWASNGGFERAYRLRPLFALALQRQVVSNLTRVGVPVGPARITPLRVRLKATWNAEVQQYDDGAFLVVQKNSQGNPEKRIEFTDSMVIQVWRYIESSGPLDEALLTDWKKCLAKPIEKWVSAFTPISPSTHAKELPHGLPIDIVYDAEGKRKPEWETEKLARLWVTNLPKSTGSK